MLQQSSLDHDRSAMHEVTKRLAELGFRYAEDEVAATTLTNAIATSVVMPPIGENFYQMAQGDGDDKRDGRKIRPVLFQLSGHLTWPTITSSVPKDDRLYTRIMLVHDSQWNGSSAANPGAVLSTTGAAIGGELSMQSVINAERYTILKDVSIREPIRIPVQLLSNISTTGTIQTDEADYGTATVQSDPADLGSAQSKAKTDWLTSATPTSAAPWAASKAEHDIRDVDIGTYDVTEIDVGKLDTAVSGTSTPSWQWPQTEQVFSFQLEIEHGAVLYTEQTDAATAIMNHGLFLMCWTQGATAPQKPVQLTYVTRLWYEG
jgi:hypothetical protein